ncbi:hypothetical protein R3W88_024789 [Solanum pinnatisectum]|uniref:Uncharacterized protein n=1 Tax=Solanum pinnatisectum TaxID=50273 RepID=A0AAV9M1F2_9SOLN|nr:hypothetical protein R3W88_024789 [Solanum pinnatisectum]
MKENGMPFNSSGKDFAIRFILFCEYSDILMHLLFQLFSVDFWKQKKGTNKLLVLQDFHRHCWN